MKSNSLPSAQVTSSDQGYLGVLFRTRGSWDGPFLLDGFLVEASPKKLEVLSVSSLDFRNKLALKYLIISTNSLHKDCIAGDVSRTYVTIHSYTILARCMECKMILMRPSS